MDMLTLEQLGEPRFLEAATLRVAGLAGEYTMEQIGEIPKQWRRFMAELDELGARTGESYGIVLGERGRPMRYVCGVRALELSRVPKEWETVEIPGQPYAVFAGKGGVRLIRQFWAAIWNVWLPASGRTVREGPMVEWYAPDFDGEAGGAFEIRIPVEP